MKISLVVLASLLIGLTGGVVSALWQTDLFSNVSLEAALATPDTPGMLDPAPPGKEPRLVIDAPHYHFGHMERQATGRHTFKMKNVGDYPLALRKLKTSCKCTLSDLTDLEVLPGESADVTLEWTAKTGDTLFRQDATIATNDPRRPVVTLTIEGMVVDSTVVNPPEIVFSNLTSDEEASGKTRVFTSLSDDLRIVGHTCENAETADFFAIRSEPLPKDSLPPEMKSGCEVVVTVKPGLPQGAIQQKIRMQMNVSDVPDAEVRIGGRIGSPILIVGREWDQERGVIRLGTINRSEGTKRQLKLMIRGAHRKEIELRAPQVQPALLKVTLGEPQELSNVVAVPLSIEVPPGSPAVNHLGNDQGIAGEITIPTNQPELGDVRLKVTFAVSD